MTRRLENKKLDETNRDERRSRLRLPNSSRCAALRRSRRSPALALEWQFTPVLPKGNLSITTLILAVQSVKGFLTSGYFLKRQIFIFH